MSTRAARVFLWGAAGYGLFGAFVFAIAAVGPGERSLLRVASGLLVIGAVAVMGLHVTGSTGGSMSKPARQK